MSFSTVLFTEKGRALQAKAIAGAALNFTKIEMGSGSLGGQSQVTLTSLIHSEVELDIESINRDLNYASIRGIFNNSDVSTGFYWREVGVFAQDPDLGEILYCYGNAGSLAEYIPPQSSEILEKVISLSVVVGNATNVTATINQSLVYATAEDLADLNEELSTIQKAGGTAIAITLTGIALVDGYCKSFIVKANNNAVATTINGKPLYKPNTTTVPKLKSGTAVTVWYDIAGDCFFIRASTGGGGTVTTGDVLAPKTFVNEDGDEIAGTIPSKLSATYTPGTTDQEIASGQYLSGKQTIKGDAKLLPANISKGTTIFNVAGTLDTRQLNFPLSIQDAEPSPLRVGHIWVKSSTLAAQITAVKILEAVNAGETDGTLMMVVGDLALHSVSFGNTVDVTNGGYKYTSMSDTISSTADWEIIKKSGDVAASYKINRPFVYSKIGGVLDVETTYYWDGANWVLLCEKDNYIVWGRMANSTAANDGLVLAYKVGDSLVRQTSYDGGGRITTSRDGKYILCPGSRTVSLSPTNYLNFKLYKRTGDILVPYFILTSSLQIEGSSFYYKDAEMSADGQYLAVVWRNSAAQWVHYLQIYRNTGTTFELIYSYILPNSTISTDYLINIVVALNGEFVGVLFGAGASYFTLGCFFKNGSTYNYSTGTLLYSYGQSYGSEMALSYDEKSLIISAGTSTNQFRFDKYGVDYLAKTVGGGVPLESASDISTGGLVWNRNSNAQGFTFYYMNTYGYLICSKIVNNVITKYSVSGAPTVYLTGARFNIDMTRCYIWVNNNAMNIFSLSINETTKVITFTLLGTYASTINIGANTANIQVVPS